MMARERRQRATKREQLAEQEERQKEEKVQRREAKHRGWARLTETDRWDYLGLPLKEPKNLMLTALEDVEKVKNAGFVLIVEWVDPAIEEVTAFLGKGGNVIDYYHIAMGYVKNAIIEKRNLANRLREKTENGHGLCMNLLSALTGNTAEVEERREWVKKHASEKLWLSYGQQAYDWSNDTVNWLMDVQKNMMRMRCDKDRLAQIDRFIGEFQAENNERFKYWTFT